MILHLSKGCCRLQLGREGSFAYGCADAGSAGHRKSSRAGSCMAETAVSPGVNHSTA